MLGSEHPLPVGENLPACLFGFVMAALIRDDPGQPVPGGQG